MVELGDLGKREDFKEPVIVCECRVQVAFQAFDKGYLISPLTFSRMSELGSALNGHNDVFRLAKTSIATEI